MVATGVTLLSLLFSVLTPQKMWFNPSQPLTIKCDKDANLELTDFLGTPLTPKGSTAIAASQSVDLKTIYPDTAQVGTFILYALPKDAEPSKSGAPKNFLGTPLVIEVLAQPNDPLKVVVTHVLPLQYAVMTTTKGPLTEVFYYDAAPHTIDNFLGLSIQGYYDGIAFHRVVKDFMIQCGDPLSTDPDKRLRGSGGPGYTINDEFNDYPHTEGVLSMANTGDPNSAGSQFFICMNDTHRKSLDHRYTAFGKVTSGMDIVQQIDHAPVEGEAPVTEESIVKMDILPVTAANDPYLPMMPGK